MLEKKLGCKFIRINTSKEGYDADYEASRTKTFISKFKDRRLKRLNKKIKRTRRQNRNIYWSNHSIKSKCLKYIVKKNTVHNIRHEKRTIKNKTDKNWERNWNNVLFRCKGYTDSFKPQEVKMTKYLEKNQTMFFVNLLN